MIRPAAALLAAAALVAGGCGGDEKEEPAATSTPAAGHAGDVERYCALVDELDRAGDEIFGKLEHEKASRAEFRKAEEELVKRFSQELDEITELVPEEIASDVETLVASVRARGGEGAPVPAKEAAAAEKRVEAYEDEHCTG